MKNTEHQFVHQNIIQNCIQQQQQNQEFLHEIPLNNPVKYSEKKQQVQKKITDMQKKAQDIVQQIQNNLNQNFQHQDDLVENDNQNQDYSGFNKSSQKVYGSQEKIRKVLEECGLISEFDQFNTDDKNDSPSKQVLTLQKKQVQILPQKLLQTFSYQQIQTQTQKQFAQNENSPQKQQQTSQQIETLPHNQKITQNKLSSIPSTETQLQEQNQVSTKDLLNQQYLRYQENINDQKKILSKLQEHSHEQNDYKNSLKKLYSKIQEDGDYENQILQKQQEQLNFQSRFMAEKIIQKSASPVQNGLILVSPSKIIKQPNIQQQKQLQQLQQYQQQQIQYEQAVQISPLKVIKPMIEQFSPLKNTLSLQQLQQGVQNQTPNGHFRLLNDSPLKSLQRNSSPNIVMRQTSPFVRQSPKIAYLSPNKVQMESPKLKSPQVSSKYYQISKKISVSPQICGKKNIINQLQFIKQQDQNIQKYQQNVNVTHQTTPSLQAQKQSENHETDKNLTHQSSQNDKKCEIIESKNDISFSDQKDEEQVNLFKQRAHNQSQLLKSMLKQNTDHLSRKTDSCSPSDDKKQPQEKPKNQKETLAKNFKQYQPNNITQDNNLINDIENNLDYVQNVINESDIFEKVIYRGTPTKMNRSDYLAQIKDKNSPQKKILNDSMCMDKIKIENSEDGTIKKKVESFFSNKKPPLPKKNEQQYVQKKTEKDSCNGSILDIDLMEKQSNCGPLLNIDDDDLIEIQQEIQQKNGQYFFQVLPLEESKQQQSIDNQDSQINQNQTILEIKNQLKDIHSFTLNNQNLLQQQILLLNKNLETIMTKLEQNQISQDQSETSKKSSQISSIHNPQVQNRKNKFDYYDILQSLDEKSDFNNQLNNQYSNNRSPNKLKTLQPIYGQGKLKTSKKDPVQNKENCSFSSDKTKSFSLLSNRNLSSKKPTSQQKTLRRFHF